MTSLELVEDCLRRIDEYPSGAIVTVNLGARREAAALDGRRDRGPLHGIPVVVKDVFETEGVETTFGCRAFAGYVPQRDAEAVRRLRAAGAVVVAKTSTPDLAMSWLSGSSLGVDPVNAHSRLHEPGGSSGGSAVAVAAGLVTAGLGSDTGGSVRVPASFNGVVGMRPTTGLVPTAGMSALVRAQDTPGPLASCVEDVALLLGVLSGSPLFDEPERPLAGRRLGLLTLPRGHCGWDGADQVDVAVDRAMARLAGEGASVERVDVPGLPRLLREGALYLLSAREDIDAFLRSRPELGVASFAHLHRDGVFPEALDLAELLARHSDASPERRARAHAARVRLRGEIVQAMGTRRLDALAYPTVQVPPPRVDRDRARLPSRSLPVNTLIASQAALPALSLPAGATADGLPVGLELLGRPSLDFVLMALGKQVEAALSQM